MMIKRHGGGVVALALLILLGAILLCVRNDRGFVGFHGEFVHVFGPDGNGKLILTPRGGTAKTFVAYPVEQAGAALDFSDYSVLVAGRNDTEDEGVIVQYTRNAEGTMVLADTYTWSGGDAIGLTFDPAGGTLYMLDLGYRVIRSATYTAGATIPRTWSTVATSTSVPFLGSPDLCDAALWVVPGSPTRLLIGRYYDMVVEEFAWVDLAGPTQITNAGMSAWPHLDRGDHGVDATSVAFEAPEGPMIEIVRMVTDETWEVIGVGTAGPEGTGSAPVSPLQFGDIIATKHVDLPLPTAPFLTPIIRTGIAERLNAGSVLRPLSNRTGLGAYVGNSRFSVELRADHDNPESVPFPVKYEAVCAIGTPDDITVLNGKYYIDTLTQVSSMLYVKDTVGPGFAAADIPIPDDSQLAGLVYAFQWWVASGGNTVCSDIIQVVVRPDVYSPLNWAAMLDDPIQVGSAQQSGSTGPSARVTLKDWERFGRERGLHLLTKDNDNLLKQKDARVMLGIVRASLSE